MKSAFVFFIMVIVFLGCSPSKDLQKPSDDVGEDSIESTKAESGSSLDKELTLPKQKVHIVKSGESLSIIAKEYGISLEKLIEINNIKNPDMIRVGQEIVVPLKKEIVKESGDSL